MRKFLFALVGVFAGAVAFAAGDNIPTSKNYVDNTLALKQDKIAASDTTMVLTNTGTAGEYGTQGIYDPTAAYATQQSNLVDAATMNAGVQNAIDSEFQCIEWDENNECLLFDLFGQTQTQSPNVFDASQILNASGWTESNGVYSGNISYLYRLGNMNACTPGPCKENTQYTLSYTIKAQEEAFYNPNYSYMAWCSFIYTDGTSTQPIYGSGPWASFSPGETKNIQLTSTANKTIAYIRCGYSSGMKIYLSNIQLQEGTVATPYVPYGNLYIPAGE